MPISRRRSLTVVPRTPYKPIAESRTARAENILKEHRQQSLLADGLSHARFDRFELKRNRRIDCSQRALELGLEHARRATRSCDQRKPEWLIQRVQRPVHCLGRVCPEALQPGIG